MVELTGYHGTLDFKADLILKSGFIHSNKDNEWLGFGIYFFTNFNDAESWAKNELRKEKNRNKGYNSAVIEALVECDDASYCDLDVKSNFDIMFKEVIDLLRGLKGRNSTNLTEAQMRCIACNWFAEKHKIKVYNFTFPRIYHNEIGFPEIRLQQQFCVRESSILKSLSKC